MAGAEELTTTPPRWLTQRDAAAYLGVTDRTLRRMIARGDLTGYRLGPKLLRVDRDDLDALMRPIPTTGGRERGAAHA